MGVGPGLKRQRYTTKYHTQITPPGLNIQSTRCKATRTLRLATNYPFVLLEPLTLHLSSHSVSRAYQHRLWEKRHGIFLLRFSAFVLHGSGIMTAVFGSVYYIWIGSLGRRECNAKDSIAMLLATFVSATFPKSMVCDVSLDLFYESAGLLTHSLGRLPSFNAWRGLETFE